MDYRFINVTTIDGTGSPTMTQLWANDSEEALAFVNEAIARSQRRSHLGNLGLLNMGRIVYAFVFDTATKVLDSYEVRYSHNGIFTLDVR